MLPTEHFTFATLQWQFDDFAFVVYSSAGDELKFGSSIQVVSVVGRHSMFIDVSIVEVVVSRFSECCQFFRWNGRWGQAFKVIFIRRQRWLIHNHFRCFVAGGSNYNRNGTT
uniref:Uncharacterized protein n=2 Tax=Meloidogyne TaxID=189290 RepID=A0A6V7W9N4_MELEN|nr:unnamed protein product [Meloidogyne enterolobii]